jgi:hypothetical protein
MKKNYTVFFAVIAVLIVLCAFWGCSSSDDDDGPPPAEEISWAVEEQVYQPGGSEYQPGSAQTVRPESGDVGSSYADAVADVSSIDADGKLTLKLPVFNWNKFGGTPLDTGLTANPPDVKFVYVDSFNVVGSGLNLGKNRTSGGGRLGYVCADKNAVITGVSDSGESINLILKRGWNPVIPGGPGSTMVVGEHGDGYWNVYNP